MRKLLYIAAAILLAATVASAQLKNLDFEDWKAPVSESQFSNMPTSWSFTDGVIELPGNIYYPPSTNAHSNNYALYLSVWYNHTKDMAIQKAAISGRPTALNGWYQYKENIINSGLSGMLQNDTALIGVYLTKHNHSTHTTDTIGKGILEIGDSANVYTSFLAEITYTSPEIPDSITIVLDPSLVKRYIDRPGYSIDGDGLTSFLLVDNLSLSNGTTSIADLKRGQYINTYPNPTKDFIHVGNISGTISVWDICGRKMNNIVITSNKTIDVSKLPAGNYYLRIEAGKDSFQSKFIKL